MATAQHVLESEYKVWYYACDYCDEEGIIQTDSFFGCPHCNNGELTESENEQGVYYKGPFNLEHFAQPNS